MRGGGEEGKEGVEGVGGHARGVEMRLGCGLREYLQHQRLVLHVRTVLENV